MASGGLLGHDLHHRACFLTHPGSPRLGLATPHSQRLLQISSAADGLLGHLLHHFAVQDPHPGSPKLGFEDRPHSQGLFVMMTASGGCSDGRKAKSIDINQHHLF
jgi:hypothetical protein